MHCQADQESDAYLDQVKAFCVNLEADEYDDKDEENDASRDQNDRHDGVRIFRQS